MGRQQTLGTLFLRLSLRLFGLVLLAAGLTVAIWFLFWAVHPTLLPQGVYYDLIANAAVTERLIDPALLKQERWDLLGQEREVLFVHPAASGSIALVYPVRIKPKTTFQAYLAVAPEAWTLPGDGVTFSVYVEDEAGIHLVSGQYVDPKHHQQDRRWVPLQVSLAPYAGKLVRVILVVNSGPAGDGRYDWAGWGEPRLEQPIWP